MNRIQLPRLSPGRLALAAFLLAALAGRAAGAEITTVWLTHRSNDPSQIVINWESAQPGNSVVRYASEGQPLETVTVDERVTLHHVEIPLAKQDVKYRYTVQTGEDVSAEARFKGYPSETLRAAVVANWAGQKLDLKSLLADDVHLLLTAGDNIAGLHQRCGAGVRDCTQPYSELVAAHRALFATVPFMPALGNHDREIRSRGGKSPPAEPVYDIEATDFRKFFALPDDGWKWRFDIPAVGARFVALDLNHIQDLGTTWQSSHPYDRTSEQYRWYEQLQAGPPPAWVVTLHNERNSTMRAKEDRTWHKLFSQGALAVSGFGHFAERADVGGFPYFNTALTAGDKYPDSDSKFFAATPSYLLLTITKGKATAELKDLSGKSLERFEIPARRPR